MANQRPIRKRLMGTFETTMPRPQAARSTSGAAQVVVGFSVVLAAGTFLLWLMPFSTANGQTTGPLTALFTAVSAICVTGLVVVETADHWTWFGQIVVLTLIQIGGLGYMMGTTVVLWALGRRMGLRDRQMLRLYYGAPTLAETLSFVRGVAVFTAAFELTGAAVLTAAFWFEGEPLGRSIWWGVFHSVSAFNNAGFNVTGMDMKPYAGEPHVLVPLALLVIFGGLGLIPFLTLWHRRSLGRAPLDTKLVLITTAVLLVGGTLFLTASEWGNEGTFGALSPADRVLAGFFQAVMPRTAGFSAVDMGAMGDGSKLVNVALMFVGGSSGSTAGGLKVGAFAVLLFAMLATLKGQGQISVFRKRVPEMVVRQAMTLALYYVAVLFAMTLMLSIDSGVALVDVLMEVASALGTVGLSSAGTANFDSFGRILLIVTMLLGRFSPLLLVLYMTKPRVQTRYQYPEDSVRLG